MPEGFVQDISGKWHRTVKSSAKSETNNSCSKKSCTDENITRLMSDLQRKYDLVLERRTTLTGQAQNLISFTGVIETILIALLVAIVTTKDARDLLLSPAYSDLMVLIIVGFAFYIATIIFSLLAFREPTYTPAPDLPSIGTLNEQDIIKDLFLHPEKYKLEKVALQYNEATTKHQKTNDAKYYHLIAAEICLVVGIIATILGASTILL